VSKAFRTIALFSSTVVMPVYLSFAKAHSPTNVLA
jgi:hypothetical protein